MNSAEKDKSLVWQYLFSPRSVAVIGASNTPGSWGYNAMRGLLANTGRHIYPVNPNSAEVFGIKAFGSVVDIPEPVDLAMIVVTDKLVPRVLGECVTKQVKTAIIITAGFAETGTQGKALEEELARIAGKGGICFIGPNSMGHASTRTQLSTFGQTMEMPVGPAALLSQSGSTCLKIVRNLMEHGVAFSKYISTGNEADLHLEDYLEYLAEDNDTGIITAYIEGLREGRRFFTLAKEITTRKPIVVVKIGRTGESAKAVMSHTGALAGADEVYTAAFKQSGVIRVDDDDELCDVVFALLNCPLPRNNRVGILSIGGGQGALAAEACEKEGLAIGQLDPDTISKLDKYLPPRWPRRNPVDMAGPSAAEFALVADLLWTLIDDKNLDAILLLAPIIMDNDRLSDRMGLGPEEISAYREKEAKNLNLIAEKIEQYGKPVFLLGQSIIRTDPQISPAFRRVRIPVCSNARSAARVLRHLNWYRQYLEENK